MQVDPAIINNIKIECMRSIAKSIELLKEKIASDIMNLELSALLYNHSSANLDSIPNKDISRAFQKLSEKIDDNFNSYTTDLVDSSSGLFDELITYATKSHETL